MTGMIGFRATLLKADEKHVACQRENLGKNRGNSRHRGEEWQRQSATQLSDCHVTATHRDGRRAIFSRENGDVASAER